MWLEEVRRTRLSAPVAWTLRVTAAICCLVLLWLPARAVLNQNVPIEQVVFPSVLAVAGLLVAGVVGSWAGRFKGVLDQRQVSRFQGRSAGEVTAGGMTTVFTLAIGLVMLSLGLVYGVIGYLCASVDRLTGSARVRLIYTSDGVVTVVCLLVGLTFIAWLGSWVYFRSRMARA